MELKLNILNFWFSKGTIAKESLLDSWSDNCSKIIGGKEIIKYIINSNKIKFRFNLKKKETVKIILMNEKLYGFINIKCHSVLTSMLISPY